jgi:cell division protein FtsQ
VNTKDVEQALMSIPLVASAKVQKFFPDSMSITVTGRVAAAVSFAMLDGVAKIIYFDKEGVAFKVAAPNEIVDDSLPIISGLDYEHIVPGTRLSSIFTSLFTDIERLSRQSPELLKAIGEICINKKVYDSYDLILYPQYDDVKIRIGSELNEDTLRYMLLLIDVLKEKKLDVDTIDFRTGTASYTLKGDFHG